MHIVYLTGEYPKKGLNGGGIGSFVQFLGNGLITKNIKVSVIGINNTNEYQEEVDNKIDIYRLAKSNWKLGKFYQNTQRILSKIKEIDKLSKVDIVEGSELNFAFFPKKTTYKKVIRLHGGHHFFAIELGRKPAFWRGFQEKKSFKIADSFIAVSDYVGTQTQKHLKIKFSFITIYNSIDTERFKPSNSILTNNNEILFVGTVCEKKGVRNLVNALPIIKNKIPNFKLKIVGRDWVTDTGTSYKLYLKELIEKDCVNNIEFLDPVSHVELPNLIEAAEICVYPSIMESFGLTVLEALSMGKPVIASDIVPFKEIIDNNETGILFKSNSVEDLANKIIALLNNKEKIDYFNLNTRNKVLKKFNPNFIINQNLSFYESIL